MTFKRILVATDFSSAAQRAVDRAAHIARQTRAELRVVHALPEASFFSHLFHRDEALQAAMSRGAERAIQKICSGIEQTFSVAPSWAILYGRASQTLPEAQRNFDADLFVIGARGEGETTFGLPLGGTTLKLLAACMFPVLVVRRPVEDHYRTVMIAADDEARLERLLAIAGPWAEHARVQVVSSFEPPFAARLETLDISPAAIDAYATDEQKRRKEKIDAAVAKARLGDRVAAQVMRGDFTSTVIREARSRNPDLIMMDRHSAGFVNPGLGIGTNLLDIMLDSHADVLQVG
jgi:nucleotide-binding universal stress UspA family protein